MKLHEDIAVEIANSALDAIGQSLNSVGIEEIEAVVVIGGVIDGRGPHHTIISASPASLSATRLTLARALDQVHHAQALDE